MAWRPAFTLIEIMVVITIIAIVSAVAINSGVQGRQNAIFQTDFQKIVLLAQDVRSRALSNTDPLNKGFGLNFYNDESIQTVSAFVDKDGDGLYKEDTDELLETINLADLGTIGMDFQAYELIPSSESFTEELNTDGNAATVFFPSQTFSCLLQASLDENLAGNLAYIEVVFANIKSFDFTELAAQNIHQFLSFHHISCNPEVSKDSLLQ